jgi:hypothetical protein
MKSWHCLSVLAASWTTRTKLFPTLFQRPIGFVWPLPCCAIYLHLYAVQVSPATLLSAIYDRTPLIPVFALQSHGAQQVANLLKLVDLARAWSMRGLYTLAAFNRFLAHQDFVEEEPEAVVTEEHEDAVRLLTIHKAKGLEFPVVVLADMASSPQGRSPQGRGGRVVGIVERVSETLELHIGPRPLTCTTQGWQKAEAREQARDAAEEQRLWYVAAARVRDHLIVPQRPRATPENDGAQPPVTCRRMSTRVIPTSLSKRWQWVRLLSRLSMLRLTLVHCTGMSAGWTNDTPPSPVEARGSLNLSPVARAHSLSLPQVPSDG